jgi:hypothetical protein
VEDLVVLPHITNAGLATQRGFLHVRGMFSSTLWVLSLGAVCAGERAAERRDDEFNVALLTLRVTFSLQ